MSGEPEPTHRAYKCPNCGGEFDEWHDPPIAAPRECPFCALKKGQFDPRTDRED